MILLKLLKYLLIFGLLAAGAVYAFIRFHPVFGGTPDAASMAKIRASTAFDGERFNNLEPTLLLTSDHKPSLIDWVVSMMTAPADKNPQQPLPSEPFDATKLQDGKFVWFGHSTLLFQTAGQRILTDPVYYRASPVPFFGGKPFAAVHTPRIADLPAIDAVLLSHDHYDHLDYYAIKEIKDKAAHFYVPLGVKAHLQRWGVADAKITELDWYESAKLGNVSFTLAPARHFSGRKLDNRFSTLWGAWVIKSPDLSLFFGADGGYGRHFADIARRYAPFDLVMLENGSYNQDWAQVHEMPEETVRAARDLGATRLMPIHWAKFDLAYHHWTEPIERLEKAGANAPYALITPKIGQVFDLQNPPQERWWKQVK